MDSRQEVPRQFVITSGNRSILLEFLKKVFDQMTRAIEVLVILAPHDPVALRRNDRRDLSRFQHRQHPCVRVIRFVGQHRADLQARQPLIGTDQIRCLSATERQADRIAQGIRQRMDLGAQAALAAPNGLVTDVFFNAPALC